MKFVETGLPGAWVVEIERLSDERGFFARTFDVDAFAARGLRTEFPQCSISFNAKAGTLRGMHWQEAPHHEAKLIRCTAGAVYDVLLDLRPESPTFLQWRGVELSADNRRMVYAPEGMAHGFQTLEPETEVFYQISVPYHPASARGVRWDDPAFAIRWPDADERILSDRDRGYPDFAP
ncbi:MAG: dTDP-4-dehydrorhamnose 3,5-epimerase [Gemmatimonadetes bacterium]|nr:dTDP-4-dehydrorhamnose 3,5-epimerase [Gemmatimonadota bacterium]